MTRVNFLWRVVRAALVAALMSIAVQPDPSLSAGRDAGVVAAESAPTVCEAAPSGIFEDVPANSTFASSIDCLAWLGLVQGTGDGRFEPQQPVSRRQLAVMITGMFEAASQPLSNVEDARFRDLGNEPEGTRTAIERLAAEGLVRGVTVDRFEPQDSATRGQVATILVGGLGFLGAELPSGSDAPFSDAGQSHVDSLEVLHAMGIVHGYPDGTVRPGEYVTRGQLADLIARALTEPGVGDVEGGEPAIPDTRETQPKRSVSERNITIEFDDQYPVGQFVNGDTYVIGAPEITSISPDWDGVRHGAMVNPQTGSAHGYHTAVNGYDAGLNVATQLPQRLEPGDALVATAGWAESDDGAPDSTSSMEGAPRPSLRQAMVLTVLEEPPPDGSFRPAYSPNQDEFFTLDDVDWEQLPSVTTPGELSTSFAVHESRTRYVWLDHKPQWSGRYLHPSDNMPDYGRDIAARINEAILALMTDAPVAQKKPTAINVLQIGIDLAGVVDDVSAREDAYYGEFGGGHGVGRKWPVLFSGHLLGADELKDVAALPPPFWGEDGQTYISEGGSADPWRSAGEATWGERAWTSPNDPDRGRPGNRSYRSCCTSPVWPGAVLGARLMGLEDAWGHPPFFEYVDWWAEEERGEQRRMHPMGSTGGFVEEIWDRHHDG